MSVALARVTMLPTRKVVDVAWSKHVAFQRSIALDPGRMDDPIFAAEVAEAERQYLAAFERWNGR